MPSTVPLREAANLVVELALLATDMLVDREQGIDDGSKRMTITQKLDSPLPKARPDRAVEE